MRKFSPSQILVAVLSIVIGLALWVAFSNSREHSRAPEPFPGVDADVLRLARELGELQERERRIARTAWAKELLAQHSGLVVDNFWDALNRAPDKFVPAASLSFGELLVPKFEPAKPVGLDILLHEPSAEQEAWTQSTWRKFLNRLENAGWELEQTEFRHNAFETGSAGNPKRSLFYFSAHLTNAKNSERAVLEGDLHIFWARTGSDRLPEIERIDAGDLILKTRRGAPPFELVLNETIAPPPKSHFIDPLILYDLDGDGLSEIILAARNLVYRRDSAGNLQPEPLLDHAPGLIFSAVMADFDGDGAADFLCAKPEGLVLFRGSPEGRFHEPGRLVWAADPPLRYAQVLTCGDINRNGRLDIWLGQYKVPYEHGQMPVPYYDANDGHPSYLLLNDGQGGFIDATEEAGLGEHRRRRVYSASFADVNHDGHLDLIVVSDFAGLDLYLNDGSGRFTDVTAEWVAERESFGMAHVWADLNSDGLPDLLMIGMNSPTADRLDHLGLTRPGRRNYDAMRSRLAYGNRLFMGRHSPGFEQTALNDSIARSGWSWGCAAFDLDRDGYPDLYIANGHETRASVREYEPEFWLHDIHVASSRENVMVNAYFGEKFTRTRAQGHSYGGYEKNRLYLNQGGESFLEIGHLMGVALEKDSRNVVADDLDGDGRLDLLVTTFEAWPETRQTLRVYKNLLETGGNWIGFRLREEGGGFSPAGARVTVRHEDGVRTRELITGDSFRSQHPNTVFFGLGDISRVEQVEVRWVNGRSLRLDQPAINRYHSISKNSAEN